MRSDRKVKGIIMALNSSVEEQLPAKSVVKGCKILFQKTMWVCDHYTGHFKVGGIVLGGGYRCVVFDVVYYTVMTRKDFSLIIIIIIIIIIFHMG